MSNLTVLINNKEIEVKGLDGQRVVTFKDIDTVHERPEGTAKRNFNSNKKHFVEKVDYFFVKPKDVEKYEIRTSEINNAGTYLITESGYLMLAKSLTDDLAWKVQRELVNTYFRVKENKPTCIEDVLIQSLQEMKDVKQQLNQVNNKMLETKEELKTVREVIEIRPSNSWRGETNRLMTKICFKLKDYKKPKEEAYKALEERAGCDLKIRLKNMKARQALQGVSKSKIDELNYLDVIAQDKKLIEIYTTIVGQMAIRNGIGTN